MESYQKAKEEIISEDAASETGERIRKGKRRKQAVIERGHMLARALVEILQNGGLLGAVSNAGYRITNQEEEIQYYMQLHSESMDNPKNK